MVQPEQRDHLSTIPRQKQSVWLAMSQPLPIGRFRLVDVNPDEVAELAKREDKGYLLEVDVSYLKELHDSHNDLPFMCVRMVINGVEKLVPNLRDKKEYVIHI